VVNPNHGTLLQMRNVLLLLAASAVLRCASGVADAHRPEAIAHVELQSVTPEQGAELTKTTVVEVHIRYSIQNYEPKVNYYVAPLFASKEPGITFNEFDRLTEGTPITRAEGTVTVRHAVARELRSPRLARPIKLWFYVMERTGPHTTRVIGKTEQLEFRAGG